MRTRSAVVVAALAGVAFSVPGPAVATTGGPHFTSEAPPSLTIDAVATITRGNETQLTATGTVTCTRPSWGSYLLGVWGNQARTDVTGTLVPVLPECTDAAESWTVTLSASSTELGGDATWKPGPVEVNAGLIVPRTGPSVASATAVAQARRAHPGSS